MTDIQLIHTPEYEFAYALAAIHSAYMLGEHDLVHALILNLPILMQDPDLGKIYYSEEVDECMRLVSERFGIGDEEEDVEEEFDIEDSIKQMVALGATYVGPDFFEEEDETAIEEGCTDCDCECSVPTAFGEDDEDHDWADSEVIHEEDDYLIVKIWK